MYHPMTLADLGAWLADRDDQGRRHMIAEFLEEHRHEARDIRLALLADEPAPTA